ncbi:MAG: nuclear transport factor 2 family protein [Pseudolysinimonas sp.]
MARTPKDVIADHYAAGARGDLDGMIADFADDIAWTEAAGFPLAGLYRGPQAVKTGVFMALGGDWEGWAPHIDELVADGEVVVAIGWYTATHRATGKALRTRVAHVWRVRDEKVVEFEQITDTLPVHDAAH